METTRKHKVPEMEGFQARWYAKNRGTEAQLAEYRRQAAEVTAGLPAGAEILEVAPGPGFFAVEVAKRGYRVTGLDISHTMVEIALEEARKAGVDVDFRQGDVTNAPGDLSLGNLNWAAGVGLRLVTIVGPIRADFGYRLNRKGPMDPEPNAPFAFHISLGEAF